MISIGTHYRGPELNGSRIERQLRALSRSIRNECGAFVGGKDIAGLDNSSRPSGLLFEVGSVPSINVVYYIPGSLGDFQIPKIEASRFSRKQKLLLVAVPVPKEIVESGGSVEFIINSLHQANAIAADVFARKGTEPFNFEKAEVIVDKVKQSLLAEEHAS